MDMIRRRLLPLCLLIIFVVCFFGAKNFSRITDLSKESSLAAVLSPSIPPPASARPGSLATRTASAMSNSTYGNLKILTIIMGFSDYPAVNSYPDTVRKMLFENTNSVKKFYEENSFTKLQLSGDVIGPYNLPEPLPSNNVFKSFVEDSSSLFLDLSKKLSVYEDVNKLALNSGYDVSKYNLVMYILPNVPGSINGLASDIGASLGEVDLEGFGEVKGYIWFNGIPSSPRTFAHEIGHKLGLQHANSETTNSVYRYGDPLDSMGNRKYGQFNAYHKGVLGWLAKSSITQSGTYVVGPNEIATSKVFSIAAPRTSQNVNNASTYYFDYRQPIGVIDSQVVGKFANGITFSKVYTDSEYLSAICINCGLFESFYQPISTDTDYIMADGDSYSPSFDSNTNPLQKWTVVQRAYNSAGATIFVRFAEKVKNLHVDPVVGDSGKMKVSWDAVSAPVGTIVKYQVYRNDLPIGPLTTERSYIDTPGGLPALYTVQAYDTFTELPDKKYPTGPASNVIKVSSVIVPGFSSDSVSFYTHAVAGDGGVTRLVGEAMNTYKLYWRSNSSSCWPVLSGSNGEVYGTFYTDGAATDLEGYNVMIQTIPTTFKIECGGATATVEFVAPEQSTGAGRWF